MSENIHFPSGADGLLLNLNEEQRHAVTSKQVPLAIHAGAGSGKNTCIDSSDRLADCYGY